MVLLGPCIGRAVHNLLADPALAPVADGVTLQLLPHL